MTSPPKGLYTGPDSAVTGDLTLHLRAERSGGDRVYAIAVACVDLSSNRSAGSVQVTVPRSKGEQTARP